MPALFDKLGIRFQYPDNWTLDEEDAHGGAKSVTVYSPEGAFWSVALHPRHADPHRLANAAVKAMQQEYEQIDAEPVRETLAGHEMVGFDLNFFCLDLTNTAAVRCLRTARQSLTIFYQAEDREFQKVRAVFLAMTTSLLRELTDD